MNIKSAYILYLAVHAFEHCSEIKPACYAHAHAVTKCSVHGV